MTNPRPSSGTYDACAYMMAANLIAMNGILRDSVLESYRPEEFLLQLQRIQHATGMTEEEVAALRERVLDMATREIYPPLHVLQREGRKILRERGLT